MTATVTGPHDAPPGRVALLIVDMINDLDFEGGPELAPDMLAAAHAIADLRDAADAAGVPTIFSNDNFGQWHSERSKIIEHCRRPDAPGRCVLKVLSPRENDHFVIKPMHSAFYASNLPVLLPKLGATRLIITGVAAELCVLFTAADAHMRDYSVWIPRDCVVALKPERLDWVLDIAGRGMSAEVRPSSALRLDNWIDVA
ncbi:MAG: cysteine hydrolase [Caulobacteraceae bacterium]|nr:cysteine hydrolase [Caulobacteraceae bacterium]